jgi:c-di-GMP-binding flagellar brake protein YcgR
MLANMSDSNPDRRRYPRIKMQVPVELVCAGSPPMRTTTDEISLCGCYIETMFTMDVGTKLKLSLSIKGEIIHANGVVATKYPQVGNGIDFFDMAANDSQKLSAFIAENQTEDKSTGANA